MAESQRKQTSGSAGLPSDRQGLKDNLTLLGFLIGGVGLVAGMLWLADGLSDNFKVASVAFLTFVICMGVTTALFLVNKFAIKS